MKQFVKNLILGAAAVALAAPLAHATTISVGFQASGVNGGFATTAATDGGSGSLLYSGNYGYFTVNQISALGAPIMSPGTLDTNSIQIASNSPVSSTITIYITEQGLTGPVGPTSFLSSFTSNSFTGNVTSVVESTLFSTTNQLYAGTVMSTQSFTTGNQSPTPTSTIMNVSGTYSETAVYVVTVGSGSSNVNDTVNITATSAATPEPSSLIMLGTGLMSAAGMMVRRRKIS